MAVSVKKYARKKITLPHTHTQAPLQFTYSFRLIGKRTLMYSQNSFKKGKQILKDLYSPSKSNTHRHTETKHASMAFTQTYTTTHARGVHTYIKRYSRSRMGSNWRARVTQKKANQLQQTIALRVTKKRENKIEKNIPLERKNKINRQTQEYY